MRLKNRRGAFAIITAIVFMSMVMVGAVAVDFSRLWTLKNDLQTAADAGAHAGAIALQPLRFARPSPLGGNASVISAVTLYAQSNKAMSATPVIDSVELGNWNQPTRVFTPNGAPQNAVRVVTAFNMSGLIMSAFGVPPVRMRARAVGWAEAPVTTPSCVKPWAIPYEMLMYTLYMYNNPGGTPTNADLTRPFNQTSDMADLAAMSKLQRTFTLKLQAGGGGGLSATGYSGTNLPGNYQAIVVPPMNSPNYQPNSGGGTNYRNNISGANPCYGLSVGDPVLSEPGGKVGPTMQGMVPAVCTSIDANNNCVDGIDPLTGQPKLESKPIVAGFFSCGSGCSGRSVFTINLMGSFVITKVTNQAEITGYFQPTNSSGPTGSGATTLQKPIIAQ